MNTKQKLLNLSRPASVEPRLQELGIKLPVPPEPFGTYAEAVQTGNLLFLTGMLSTEGREAKFVGSVGAEVDRRSGAQSGSRCGAQRSCCRAAAFRFARQSDKNCPAGRDGGHFGRRSRPAESRGRRFAVAARRPRKREEPLPPRIWRRKPSARRPSRIGSHFRGGA